MVYDKETIKDSTDGYELGAIFELTNGHVWQQTSTHYEYNRQFMPEVLIDGSGHVARLKINDMNEWVDAKRIK